MQGDIVGEHYIPGICKFGKSGFPVRVMHRGQLGIAPFAGRSPKSLPALVNSNSFWFVAHDAEIRFQLIGMTVALAKPLVFCLGMLTLMTSGLS